MSLPKIECLKCGHARIPRTENPYRCPRCGHVAGKPIKYRKAKVDAPAAKHEASTDKQSTDTGDVYR